MLSCLWIWLKQIKNNKNLVKYDYLCSVCGLDYLPPPPYVGCIAMMATMATQWKMGIDV